MHGPVTAASRTVACCAAALALVGCAAGQISQTSREFSAVDGTSGNVGNGIGLRDVLIPYPHNQTDSYPIGTTVPVLLSIINQGASAEQLVGVDSPAAGQVLVEGTTQIPPGVTLTSIPGAAPMNVQPTSPLIGGELRIMLTTNQVVHAGLDIPITFQFQHAGKLTLSVPMGAV
ncbi:MAG: copper chaperone PCu(A)C [Pseudonocardiales bacterium]|nr:copper chaperone PCu(A)C [Pseudonocardiales bacterium]